MTSVYYIDTSVFMFHFTTLSYIRLKSYYKTNRNSFNTKGITARKRVLGKKIYLKRRPFKSEGLKCLEVFSSELSEIRSKIQVTSGCFCFSTSQTLNRCSLFKL